MAWLGVGCNLGQLWQMSREKTLDLGWSLAAPLHSWKVPQLQVKEGWMRRSHTYGTDILAQQTSVRADVHTPWTHGVLQNTHTPSTLKQSHTRALHTGTGSPSRLLRLPLQSHIPKSGLDVPPHLASRPQMRLQGRHSHWEAPLLA